VNRERVWKCGRQGTREEKGELPGGDGCYETTNMSRQIDAVLAVNGRALNPGPSTKAWQTLLANPSRQPSSTVYRMAKLSSLRSEMHTEGCIMAGDSWHSSKIIHPRYRGWSGSNKKSPPMVLRADSFECDVTRLSRGLLTLFSESNWLKIII
jgi:hypothetical protein